MTVGLPLRCTTTVCYLIILNIILICMYKYTSSFLAQMINGMKVNLCFILHYNPNGLPSAFYYVSYLNERFGLLKNQHSESYSINGVSL